jgi:hypothetical protein
MADVFAAGDCVETYHRLLARPVYIPLGTTAHKQGRVAGENAAGGLAEFQGSLGTQVVKVFDLAVARTGLNQREAAAAGFQAASTLTTDSITRPTTPGLARCGSRSPEIAKAAGCWALGSSGHTIRRLPSGSTSSRRDPLRAASRAAPRPRSSAIRRPLQHPGTPCR